ncbi:hypothetical protein BDB00DRAFT_789188 [Zychaea mexicana]|uniref:uncharacterized protein n=1 Tax=Zychaea mexicana TaxID=64656 RepID=UPI0022FDE157|nr:uncharacterized protein BDB00DRAFT_789188 [Zychaea mexicana]KAI9491867.1 hypothetical protein BDB00DRAFT_789188 [Zychaea mexicana]
MLLSSHPLISPRTRIARNQPQGNKVWDASDITSSRTTLGYVNLQDVPRHQGSLADVVKLASREHTCHDATTGQCYNCDTVAMYYLLGIEWVLKGDATTTLKRDDLIPCTADLLELVWQMCQMVIAHLGSSYQAVDWFKPMTKQLWTLAKQLKEEASGSDCYVANSPTSIHHHHYFSHHRPSGAITPTSPPQSPVVFEGEGEETQCDEQEMYRRAIRITIYNCRALMYQHGDDIDKATVYFRKCVAVRPPALEQQKLLRQSAVAALDRLTQEYFTAKSISSSLSCSSGGSSSSSSSSCGNCGVEKRTMPVCARCRAKSYCSARCLVAHKIAHEQECKERMLLTGGISKN